MIADGWLNGTQRVKSPHFNERPDLEDISLLVIHNISLPPAEFGNHFVEEFFSGKLDCSIHPYFAELKELRVSSHLYIKRTGEVIQFVPFQYRAWHAGVSRFNGRENCNDFSIGIELEGTDHIPFTEQQYSVLADITNQLMRTYPRIKRENIVGHSDIAPGRKTDPGEFFNWAKFFSLL